MIVARKIASTISSLCFLNNCILVFNQFVGFRCASLVSCLYNLNTCCIVAKIER